MFGIHPSEIVGPANAVLYPNVRVRWKGVDEAELTKEERAFVRELAAEHRGVVVYRKAGAVMLRRWPMGWDYNLAPTRNSWLERFYIRVS